MIKTQGTDATVRSLMDAVSCAGCGVLSPGLLKCSGCRRVAYCGPECQRSHWKQSHKQHCAELAREATVGMKPPDKAERRERERVAAGFEANMR